MQTDIKNNSLYDFWSDEEIECKVMNRYCNMNKNKIVCFEKTNKKYSKKNVNVFQKILDVVFKSIKIKIINTEFQYLIFSIYILCRWITEDDVNKWWDFVF